MPLMYQPLLALLASLLAAHLTSSRLVVDVGRQHVKVLVLYDHVYKKATKATTPREVD